LNSAANGNFVISQSGVGSPLTIAKTTGAATFASDVSTTNGVLRANGTSYGILSAKGSGSHVWQAFANPSDEFRIGTAGVGDAIIISNSFAVSMSSTLSVTSTVTASAFYESSDSTLKNIIQRFSTPQGFDFVIGSWKTDKTNAQHFWNIAQEVERVYPQMVSTNEQGLKSINYIELHNKEIYDLQIEVAELKSIIKSMQK